MYLLFVKVKNKCLINQFYYKLFHYPLRIFLSQERELASSPNSDLLRIQIFKCAVKRDRTHLSQSYRIMGAVVRVLPRVRSTQI